MNFKHEKIRNFYLRDTSVENIFLMEYMPGADGMFVKVYLTALMYADYEDFSNRQLAACLGITEEDVLNAWNYWEKCGAVRKHYVSLEDRFHYSIEFLNLKAGLFDPQVEEENSSDAEGLPSEAVQRMDDENVRRVFARVQEITGRMMTGREPQEILSWMYDDGLSPDLVIYAYQYCAERVNNRNFSYISAVIKNWRDGGILTVKDAEALLAENDQKYNQYHRVMKALGFSRNPTEDEKKKIDSWFEVMGFSIDTVLQACSRTSGISNPNINYVNAILKNWSGGKSGSSEKRTPAGKNAVSLVNQMYEEIRQRHTEEREQHRSEIYRTIPRIREIDEALRRTNLAFTKLTLSGGGKSSAEALAMERKELTEEKVQLLQTNGYPADYMELHYDCVQCKDTGILDNGSRCSCFADKLRQAAGSH